MRSMPASMVRSLPGSHSNSGSSQKCSRPKMPVSASSPSSSTAPARRPSSASSAGDLVAAPCSLLADRHRLDHDVGLWPILAVCLDLLHRFDNLEALDDLAEQCVLRGKLHALRS